MQLQIDASSATGVLEGKCYSNAICGYLVSSVSVDAYSLYQILKQLISADPWSSSAASHMLSQVQNLNIYETSERRRERLFNFMIELEAGLVIHLSTLESMVFARNTSKEIPSKY